MKISAIYKGTDISCNRQEYFSFVYNAMRERSNQAVRENGVIFSIFSEATAKFPLLFHFRLNAKSIHRLIDKSTYRLINFPLTLYYIASRFWGRLKIFCLRRDFVNFSASQALFDIYKFFFKQIFRSIIKPKTGLQILYSNNLNYELLKS